MVDRTIQEKLLRLSDLGENVVNVWAQPSVNVVPTKTLDSWAVVKVIEVNVSPEQFGFHFVGRDVNEQNGAVSSKIVEFYPQQMQGKTQSGRVYQLDGRPGNDGDAEYVLRAWCRINQVVIVDATQEFLQSYGVPVEDLK